MNRFSLLMFLLLAVPMLSSGQTEEKPKYAPGKEKHRNKTDELGQKQGPWRTYNSLGDLISEVEYVNDVRHGKSTRYYPYGKVMEEQDYQNGIKEGTYKRYYYSGQVKQEGEYVAGKRESKWTRYYEDGEISSEGTYKNNKRDGEWKTLNRKGQVTGSTTYKDGVDLKAIADDAKKAEAAKKAAAKKGADKKGAGALKPGEKDSTAVGTPNPGTVVKPQGTSGSVPPTQKDSIKKK